MLEIMMKWLDKVLTGGGGNLPVRENAMIYSGLKTWTIKGDSSANAFARRWEHDNIDNNARDGSTIDLHLKYPDTRALCHVILMVGGNNVGLYDESADLVLEKYRKLYSSIKATGKILCVGISPFFGTEGFSHRKNFRIALINRGIKKICGQKNYIDTWPPRMFPTTTDGVHHTEKYDQQIRRRILSAVGSFPNRFKLCSMLFSR